MSKYLKLLFALRLVVGTVVSVALLAGAGYGAWYLMNNKPKPQRRPPQKLAPLVQVEDVVPGPARVVVKALGNVVPAIAVTLQTRVPGEVVERHAELIDGGRVRAGEVLVRIDPADYELTLATRQTQLAQAEANLSIERGQQDVARREWAMLDMADQASERDRELALRNPQLRKAEAEVAAAKAQVEQAELDLARTRVKAPFDAIVRTASVDVGDQATTQSVLAELVCTEAYWVEASIAVDELKWISLPGTDGSAGSPVRVFDGDGHAREGRVLKLLSDLVPEGRFARLLVEVENPLDVEESGAAYPLLLGQFVRAEILGRALEDVYSVPRDAMREGERIWLAEGPGTLRVEQADVVWADTERALLRGLEGTARVIVSDLATPVNGMAIQVDGEVPAAEAAQGPGSGRGGGAQGAGPGAKAGGAGGGRS